jgi:hypothetical protein
LRRIFCKQLLCCEYFATGSPPQASQNNKVTPK